jgi:hypothetical protein
MPKKVKQTFMVSAPNGSSEPNLPFLCNVANGCFHQSEKSSTIAWVLNGVFGSVKQCGLGAFQKGGRLCENHWGLCYTPQKAEFMASLVELKVG